MRNKSTESPSIKLREAGFLDIPKMVKIERKVFKRPWGFDAFFGEMFKSFSRVYVAEVEGKIAGYIVLWILPPEGYIANVAVSPDYQGKGVGKALLKKAISVCEEEGVNSICLEVRRSNQTAISLYKKFGFEVVGIRKAMYHDGEDGLVMEKLL